MEGIKRINEMAVEQKGYVVLEIVKYLTSRKDMNDKYLNPEKTLKGMESYIQGEIIKEFCKKMNTKNPTSFAETVTYEGKNIKCLPVGMTKERTFGLAINYFEKSNEELGIKIEETKPKKIQKNIEDDEFGSIFDVVQSAKIEKKQEIEQISLFTV